MKNSIELLRATIEMKEHEIRKMQSQIADKEKQQSNIELDPDDFADQFDEMLDESGEVSVGYTSFYPSRILKELDPIGYRCGLTDFVDSLDVEDSDEYQSLQSEIDDIQDEIDQLESDIEDLENQIADLTE